MGKKGHSSRKNTKTRHSTFRKTRKTKRRTADIDQIHDELEKRQVKKIEKEPFDPDLPGMGQFKCVTCDMGQFKCVTCDRYFITEAVLEAHRRTKVHKKRLSALKDPPYTYAEAMAGANKGPPVNV
eukprot:g10002.t1